MLPTSGSSGNVRIHAVMREDPDLHKLARLLIETAREMEAEKRKSDRNSTN